MVSPSRMTILLFPETTNSLENRPACLDHASSNPDSKRGGLVDDGSEFARNEMIRLPQSRHATTMANYEDEKQQNIASARKHQRSHLPPCKTSSWRGSESHPVPHAGGESQRRVR